MSFGHIQRSEHDVSRFRTVERLTRSAARVCTQVRVLKRSLAEAKTELDDLKTLVSSATILVAVGVVFASLPSEWWVQTFSELAATELVA